VGELVKKNSVKEIWWWWWWWWRYGVLFCIVFEVEVEVVRSM